MCLAAAPAVAQGLPQDETLLFQDLSRVVGASRYEQETREAPASITIITAEEIRRFGYRTLGEALASVRGFVVNSDRNYTYAGVRGFAVPGDFNSRILVLVDGHRVNENVYESALLGHSQLIDLRLVERIEVVRGPSSSIYGTSALFGVVNIVTQKARWLDGVEATAATGNFGSHRGSLAAGRQFTNGAELYLFGSLFASDGQDLYFPEFDDPATNFGMARNADRERYHRAFAKLTWSDFTLQTGYNMRRKLIPTGSYETIFNDNRARTIDERAFVFLRYGHGFADFSRIEATLSFDAYNYLGDYPYTDGLFTDYGIARWWTLSGQYVLPLDARHRLVVGGEARWNARQDQGGDNADSGTVILRTRRHGAVWAVFAQDEWRIAPRLLVSAGVRHDAYETFGGTTNPRVAVVYQTGRRGAFKLLYGRAFRTPNAYELDYQDGGLSTKAPPSLRPETIESYELVFEGVPTPGLRLTATAFHLQLRDLVTQVEDPADGLLVYQNVGRARSTGVEIEADVRLASQAAVGASYTYQRATDAATGADWPSSPHHLAIARVSLPALGDRLRASLGLRYASGQRTVTGVGLPPRTVGDLTVLGRGPADRVVVTTTVYNLFDAVYRDPGGSEQAVAAIPQDRRHIRVGLQVRF